MDKKLYKSIFKKTICIGILFLMSTGFFSACEQKNLTEEEHIQRISEKVHNYYINPNGKGYYVVMATDEHEHSFRKYTGFAVEIICAFDDTPEYFLVEFEPFGYLIGFISGRKYLKVPSGSGYSDDGNPLPSPYKIAGIETKNKYFDFNYGCATIINGELTSIIDSETGKTLMDGTGMIFNEQERKTFSEWSRKVIRNKFKSVIL